MAGVSRGLERLKPTLTEVIYEWVQKVTEEENELGWIGPNLAVLMSDAAFAVLLASEDIQDYMRQEDVLRG